MARKKFNKMEYRLTYAKNKFYTKNMKNEKKN